MAQRTNHDAERDEEFAHGYEAAANGQTNFRHSRYWIDDTTGAELCRPGVVAGIVAYYRDADSADQRDTMRDLRAGAVQ